ncbi:MAG TPA: 1-deoxy-D-xylulose-5-phosphate reductoisomerase [Clostridiales bacterium]|jgi:1-deoxy-D-xylulose-5-phosphate reductoisomerase|nr:1-deoxy-D-xylulose-5-phosphate reductoisomerase [Clostridiales bacterium]
MNLNTTAGSTAVIGSTGSVGCQTLEVLSHLGIRPAALAANSDAAGLERQCRLYRPDTAALFDKSAARDLKIRLADTGIKVLSGADGVNEIAASADTVFNSASGIAGLAPTMAAVKNGRLLALANKESLITAGNLVMKTAAETGSFIRPVDSEHNAIWQCLEAGNPPSRLILTCSGGPFFGYKKEQLENITAEDALRHPTWSMGTKISIDSATLMNKGFEVIEAAYLFSMPTDRIEVVVHRQSIVHSMVEFSDGSVKAQLSCPDMRLCIMYALSYPRRADGDGLIERLDFTKNMNLDFSPPDTSVFRLLPLAGEAMKRGGVIPAVLNGANERAVGLFLEGRISFRGITDSVEAVTSSFENYPADSLEAVYAADLEARKKIDEYFNI